MTGTPPRSTRPGALDHLVKRGDTRYPERGNVLRAMAVADGYVMCRHPGSHPLILGTKQWLELPTDAPADT